MTPFPSSIGLLSATNTDYVPWHIIGATPNASEKEDHYHHRFIQPLPKAGHGAINDRNWYGRVTIERVKGQCTRAKWEWAYRKINKMEAEYSMSSEEGVVKFWLEISKDEQLRRFEQRRANLRKISNITDNDRRNREKWDLYDKAIDELLAKTNTRIHPGLSSSRMINYMHG
jgi:polyphosphate kinase 2 (PPK2 family)